MQVHSALLFETPEEIYARVHRELRPRVDLPAFRVEFCRFTNANSFIRLRGREVVVRITDVLQNAPSPVQEALAFILLAKLYRQPVPPIYNDRYRRYLNRLDVRHSLHQIRRIRGRKIIDPPLGHHYHLDEIFDDLNRRFFGSRMDRPCLGWSKRASRRTLGHYDPSHNAIVVSRILDRPDVPRLALEYVLFHEMLHLRHPAEHNGTRRSVHTKAFREAERQFPELRKAKELLKHL